MATSESDIRNAVSLLLKQHGCLNTSEVKDLLCTVMPFDADDLKPSATRSGEPLIRQRIGNVTSHQKEKIQDYYDSYRVDKNFRPAAWTMLTGLKSKEELKPISKSEVEKRKAKRRSFKPQKINWEEVNFNRTELGRLGEEFVLRSETSRVLGFADEDIGRIIHLSETQGDGAGFDIISLNEDGSDRYIEVKTTEGGVNTPFYMTENERARFEISKDDDDLFVYRVFDFDKAACTGSIRIIPAKELLLGYAFDPVSYKVSKL